MYGGAIFTNNSNGIFLGTDQMNETSGTTSVINNVGEFVA
jgi:hypothetical protein